MSRRERNGLSSMISHMMERMEWAARGRIHFMQRMWRFMAADDPTPVGNYAKPNGQIERLVRVDSSGRKYELVPIRSVYCPHPQWEGCDYVPGERGYNVPASVCRKCEQYRKSTNKVRYPTCAWRAEANSKQSVGERMADMMAEATRKAVDVVEGKR